MKKWIDIIAKRIFTVSGFVTSIAIVLIIAFLFAEAVGLFSQPIIEEGYVLALNKQNNVKDLSALEIKDIFDEEITNWKEVGGNDTPITVFRLEDLDKIYTEAELGDEYQFAGDKIVEQVSGNPGMIAFVPESLVEGRTEISYIDDNTIPVKDVLLGVE